MSEPTDLVLVYLRRIDQRLERLEGNHAALLERMASLENGQALLRREVAHIHGEMARIDHRIDRVEQRLDRIERCLDLIDTSATDQSRGNNSATELFVGLNL